MMSALQRSHNKHPLIGPDWSRDLSSGLWLVRQPPLAWQTPSWCKAWRSHPDSFCPQTQHASLRPLFPISLWNIVNFVISLYYWLLIGRDRSRDLNAGLWLVTHLYICSRFLPPSPIILCFLLAGPGSLLTLLSSFSLTLLYSSLSLSDMACDWSQLVTWPVFWPLIGPDRSRDLNTDLVSLEFSARHTELSLRFPLGRHRFVADLHSFHNEWES